MDAEDLDPEISLISRSSGDQTHRHPLYFLVIAITCFATSIALIMVGGFLYGYVGGTIPFDYGIVIDAGSSHSTVFLYNWFGLKDRGTGDVIQVDDCYSPGGIADLTDPTPIVACVRNVTQRLTMNTIRVTPLYVGATAGMRLLNISNSKEASLIMLALKYSLSQANVDVKKVEIISGQKEGLSAWITANYLKKVLTLSNLQSWNLTYGALDLGGASTQVAYGINSPVFKNTSDVVSETIFGHSYNVFSKSQLCFGVDEAYHRHQALLISSINSSLILEPCLPSGAFKTSTAEYLFDTPCTKNEKFQKYLCYLKENDYMNMSYIFNGTSDYVECQQKVDLLLNIEKCEGAGFERCPEKVDIPHVNMTYLAFSSFYYVTSFLNASDVPLSKFVEITKTWCKMTWPEMREKFPTVGAKYLQGYCFGAIYMTSWLTRMYGFNDSLWETLFFVDRINGSNIGWSMGYMLDATNAMKQETPSASAISLPVLIIFILCGVLIAGIGFVFCCKYVKKENGYLSLSEQ